MKGAAGLIAAGIGLTALVLAVGSSGGAAAAQEVPPPPPAPATSGADPWSQAVVLAIQTTSLEEKADAVRLDLDTTQANAAQVETDFHITDDLQRAAQVQVEAAEQRMRRRVALAYEGHGGDQAKYGVDDVQDLASADQYVGAATGIDTVEIERLRKRSADLAARRDQLAASRQRLADDLARLTKEFNDLSARLTNAKKMLDALGGVPVMGQSHLTAEQLTAWFVSTGAHANLPEGTTIAELATMYIEEGAAENVRGDLAFAQSVLETGSFRETHGNNYSGIGNCDSCGGKGMMFPTPREGVRAQIQLLRNYADPASRAANLKHPPDPTLYAVDPGKAAREYDTFYLKGKVPLWNQMGNGNWATSTTYSVKVLTIYDRMLAFVAAPS